MSILERPTVLIDDRAPGSTGVLVLAAARATSDDVAFVVRHSSGVLEVPLAEGACDRLNLPPMPGASVRRTDRPAYTVSVDAADGIGTGISATDRARTARLLGSPGTRPDQLSRPGHILPIRVNTDAATGLWGPAEAAVALVSGEGGSAAAVIAAVTTPDGQGLASAVELHRFAAQHSLATATLSAVVTRENRRRRRTEVVAETGLPTARGTFRALGLRSLPDGAEHLALIAGDVTGDRPVPVSVHTECLLGDVFGAGSCFCGARLTEAQDRLGHSGYGVVLYLRPAVASGWACPGPADPDIVASALSALGVRAPVLGLPTLSA